MGTITTATKKGPRPYQEDRNYETYIPNQKWQLLAVMDGHNGAEVSNFCVENIHRMIPLDNPNPENSLASLVANLNSTTRNYEAGSTFSAAIITNKTVTVAILGDSPVIILDSKGKLHISPEHNVRTNLKEREAAKCRGAYYDPLGYICFGNYELQVSRALGDCNLDKILSRKPEIYIVKNPVWVLVASDGLLDPGHENPDEFINEIGEFAKNKADADVLMRWTEKRGLNDNATAIVWCK